MLALASLALLPLALAQYEYGPPPAASSSVAAAAPAASASAAPGGTGTVFTVIVGGGSLVYSPNSVTAAIGDTVVFEFRAKNHSVVQSTFAAPCVPLAGGINSGFMPVAAGATGPAPTCRLTINDTKPIWIHCTQVSHCSSGMVMGINAPTTGNTVQAFVAAAMGGAANSTAAAGAGASGMATSAAGAASASGSAAAAATTARSSSTMLQVGSALALGVVGCAFSLLV